LEGKRDGLVVGDGKMVRRRKTRTEIGGGCENDFRLRVREGGRDHLR